MTYSCQIIAVAVNLQFCVNKVISKFSSSFFSDTVLTCVAYNLILNSVQLCRNSSPAGVARIYTTPW